MDKDTRTPVKTIVPKYCITCTGLPTRLINIFGNKSRRENFVETLENILGVNYSDFENSGSDVLICEKCYKTVLNYAMFRENAVLNYKNFCKNTRKKRLPIATPENIKKTNKCQRITVADQITRSVEKLHIDSCTAIVSLDCCTAIQNHASKARKRLDISCIDSKNPVTFGNTGNCDFSGNLKTFLIKLNTSLREINRKGETVLQEKNTCELLNGSIFEKALAELHTKVPLLFDIFKTLLNIQEESELRPSERVTMATMYAMIMQTRNKQSSAIQRVYTALVIRSHADNSVSIHR